MRKTVIASAVRTPGGSFGGKLASLGAAEMGALVVNEAVKRAGISPEAVDELIFGCGWQAGVGPNVARISSVNGGLPFETTAYTVNMRCGSSLKAVAIGASMIKSSDSDVLVVGGTESSTNVPYLMPDARWGCRMGDKPMVDILHKDGFMCKLAGMLMGNTAELLVDKYQISRLEQDEFAVESHMKAVKAIKEGKFKEEILPVEVKVGKAMETFDTDETPRENIDILKMGKLSPVFQKDGTVSAGNSCALCDAASAMVIMSEEKAAEINVKPMARIISYASAGLDPKFMGLGPVDATNLALKKAGMTLSDIDLIELNEAFAAQYLAVERELKWDRSIVNVHGGAIALGHPVGATGAKILTTLLHSLKTYNKEIGMATLCIGGGQGVTVIVERIN
jgi:acetyl-CoA C-acetyltransferase